MTQSVTTTTCALDEALKYVSLGEDAMEAVERKLCGGI